MTSPQVDIKVEVGEREGYDSSFEGDKDKDNLPKEEKPITTHKDLAQKHSTKQSSKDQALPSRSHFLEEQRHADGYRNKYFALNAYERHRKLVNDYFLYYPGCSTEVLKRDDSRDKNDMDIVREHHRFIWTEEDESGDQTWEKDLAKKYYDKLFKEYGVCDLSRYKENKIAIRWRIQREVIDGKGQFTCGEKKCSNAEELRTWEVNFAYLEDRVKKNALVKLRLCQDCSIKLNFTYKRKEVTKKSKKRKHHKSRSSEKKKLKQESESPSTSTAPPQESEEEAMKAAENIWKAPAIIPELKSREDEYNEYLEDLFL